MGGESLMGGSDGKKGGSLIDESASLDIFIFL